MTLVELLAKYPVVIPIIQRDYAQGRKDQDGQNKYKEVRDGIIDTLYDAVVGGQNITLDYIYGSVDSPDRFLPIDGQQRLTTLFLLYWYLAVKANKMDEAKTILSRFTYEVRDSALEFCSALPENAVPLTDNPSESIRNAAWFYRVYDNDPTVRAMLVMLDALHDRFKNANASECWERLTMAKTVRFWTLTLEGFGLTDDLFIKMNARGKYLTRFETFKSEFESALDRIENSELRETWKDKIDNEWLDFFWLRYSHESAEDSIFRYILFILRSLSAKNGRFSPYTDLSSVRYQEDIKTVCSENNLCFLVDSLEQLDFFLRNECFKNLHEIFERLVGDSAKSRDITFSDRAKVYAAFRYLYIFSGNVDDYPQFERVLNNLVVGQRRLQANRKQYESSLDAQNFGGFIGAIDELIDRSHACGGILKTLVAGKTSVGGLAYLPYEIEKAKYMVVGGVIDQNRLNTIIELEKSPKLRGLIHNIFFDNTLNLTRDKLDKLLTIKPNLLLRCIQTFSKTLLLERKFNGDGKYLANVKVDDLHYNDEYYYKWFFGENDSEFGDYLLTSDNSRISSALKKFIAACAQLHFADISAEAERLLSQQIGKLPVGSESYYFAKYEEFYGEPNICACLIPQGKHFGIRTLRKGRSETGSLLIGGHYNPYYMALKNLLAFHKSNVLVKDDVIQKDKFIEEWHPLTLSNGMSLRLIKNWYWNISLNEADICQAAQDMLEDGTILKVNGADCIEKAYNFICCM